MRTCPKCHQPLQPYMLTDTFLTYRCKSCGYPEEVSRICDTCRHEDDLFCDRLGKPVAEDDSCEKWTDKK